MAGICQGDAIPPLPEPFVLTAEPCAGPLEQETGLSKRPPTEIRPGLPPASAGKHAGLSPIEEASQPTSKDAVPNIVLDQISSFLNALSTNDVAELPPPLIISSQPPAPMAPTPPPPTNKAKDAFPHRSSGRLAAKPSRVLSAMDKAQLVLMRKEGIVSSEAPPSPDALKRYKELYKEELPQHFIDAVSALVEATDVGKSKKKVPKMTAAGRMVAA